jgi:hypothetical protein
MNWYASNTGNDQGLVIEEDTGRNVAVTYDKADAPLVAAAPALLLTARAYIELADELTRNGGRIELDEWPAIADALQAARGTVSSVERGSR